MIKGIILLLFFVLPFAAFSQENVTTDGLYNFRQQTSQMDFLRYSATQLRGSDLQKAGFVNLQYRIAGGDFRVGQEARKSSTVSFNTEGISTLSKFKLYGFFSLSRSADDSLAFNMKGIKDSPQPYYFITPKAGNYSRQTYTGGGIISYALMSEKLFLSTGVDYLYNTAAGFVDPRAVVYTYHIKFNPELTYRFGQQYLGLGVSAGYGDEDVKKIANKNPNYTGQTSDPFRSASLNAGYGYYFPYQSGFLRNNNYTGLSLNYAGKVKNLLVRGRMVYEVNAERNENVVDKNVVNTLLDKFQLETTKFDLLFEKKGEMSTQQLKIHFKDEVGTDELIEKNARNYTYNSTKGELAYSLLRTRDNQRNTEWMLGFLYEKGGKRDATASHKLSFTTLEPNLGHHRYWKRNNADFISAGFNLAARLPLSTDVGIPITQVTLFSQGVVFPDYLYWSTKALRGSFRFNYTTAKLIKKFRTGFVLECSYLQALNTVADLNNATFIPRNNYLDMKVGFNIYL